MQAKASTFQYAPYFLTAPPPPMYLVAANGWERVLWSEIPLVQRGATPGHAPDASLTKDRFICQLPQAHHLSHRGSGSSPA